MKTGTILRYSSRFFVNACSILYNGNNEGGSSLNDLLKQKLAILPDKPGCYLMKDRQGTIIYVGKAKVLKNRVRSYFTGSHNAKTERLVREIVDFEYIMTSSDMEAFLLELNLIKLHDPKYNIMLKDDKTYPYLKITHERYPRLVITRKVKKDRAKYFGPYPNGYAAAETKKLLDRLYPLRKCEPMPNRVCLYYHIGQCLAPCVKDIAIETYDDMTQEIARFLKGGQDDVKKDLTKKMYEASEQLDFERAKEFRDQIAHIEKVVEHQKIISNDFTDRDVFGYAVDKGWICVQVFFVRQGKLIERDVSMFPSYGEPDEEFLTFVARFYEQGNLLPKEVLVPKEIDAKMLAQALDVAVVQPQKGKKKELLELATQNAQNSIDEKFKLIERQEERTLGACEELGDALHIVTPLRIEAFDNSHIFGADTVSAMVVFVDGKPSKKDYRKFKIQQAGAHDDYAAMREVVRRRYTRLLRDNQVWPDLIVTDGGKGQMEVVREVLEDELGLDIPIVGLAKDDKHRTKQLLYGNPPELVPLKHNSEAFYLLQRIQDEVHRFAITFHRQLHQKNAMTSVLDDIPGIGPKRKQQLLRHFGTIKKIKEADEAQLREAGLPKPLATTVIAYFSEK